LKEFYLRNNPILSATLWENEVEFENGEYPDENGKYKYDRIKDFYFVSNDVSVTLSAVSAIFQLTGINFGRFPLRPIPNIRFEYERVKKRITFNDCNPETVDSFLREMSIKLNKNKAHNNGYD
jgi:hypothetical protein